MRIQRRLEVGTIDVTHVPNAFVLDAGVGGELESYVCAAHASLVGVGKEGKSSAAEHSHGETRPVDRERRSIDRGELGAVNILSSQCHACACPDAIRGFAVDLDGSVQKLKAPISAEGLENVLCGRTPAHSGQVLAVSHCEVAVHTV